uniref:Uncharacterized protein n=1 Tax=Steinernema glaseri TaxID=37863 RepID=A0A1I8A2P8_9BILA
MSSKTVLLTLLCLFALTFSVVECLPGGTSLDSCCFTNVTCMMDCRYKGCVIGVCDFSKKCTDACTCMVCPSS